MADRFMERTDGACCDACAETLTMVKEMHEVFSALKPMVAAMGPSMPMPTLAPWND